MRREPKVRPLNTWYLWLEADTLHQNPISLKFCWCKCFRKELQTLVAADFFLPVKEKKPLETGFSLSWFTKTRFMLYINVRGQRIHQHGRDHQLFLSNAAYLEIQAFCVRYHVVINYFCNFVFKDVNLQPDLCDLQNHIFTHRTDPHLMLDCWMNYAM